MPHENSCLPFDEEMDRRVDLHLCDLDCKIIGRAVERDDGEWRIDDDDDDDDDNGDANNFHFVAKTMRSFQLCTVLLGNAVQTSPSLRVKGWFDMYRPLPISYSNCLCFQPYCSIQPVLEDCYM